MNYGIRVANTMNAKPPSNANQAEKTNDTPTNSTGGTVPDAMASQPQRPGQPTGSLSPGDSDVHPQLDGDGKRASQPGTSGAIAQTTQPQDATRELNTANGQLQYSAVAERLAVNIAQFNPAADDEPAKAASQCASFRR